MTTHTDLELDRILDAFLGEGPAAAPDRAIDAALDQIVDVRQRRSAMTVGRFQMPVSARLALVAAIILVALTAGVLFIGSQRDVPVPVPSPSAVVAPSAAAPSATPLAAVTPAPLVPAMALADEAVNRADRAITASKGPQGINDADQSRLLQLLDDVRAALNGTSDPANAKDAVDAWAADAMTRTEPLAEENRARLRGAMTALQGVVGATPFVPGPLDAGAYYTITFSPATALIVPAGWSRASKDREVLILTKGNLTFAIHKTATAATEEGLFAALGRNDATDLSPQPGPVTFPSYTGVAAGQHNGGGTLWFDERSNAYDPRPTDDIRIWVLQAGSKVITAELVGAPADVKAALAAVEQMLATMVVAQR